MRARVLELPRGARPLFEGSWSLCLDFVRRRTDPPTIRLAIVPSPPSQPDGADALVCVPAVAFDEWERRAAEAIAAWESRWLLIESAPRRHREEAREDLHHAIASALLAAAVAGVDPQGRPIDDDF